jgi:1,4-dihydroxy-2-naphthoate polyprenyltransferase
MGPGKLLSSVKLLRPIFLLGGLSMNLFGAALAYHLDYKIDWTSLICFQLMIITLQLSGHAANDYADFETDAANRNRTWFSGGSGVLPAGDISKRGAIRMSVAFAVVTILLGLTFTVLLDWNLSVLVLTIIGLVMALQYSLAPLKLSYRGFGEIFMLFVYGSICADTSFILQHGSWDNIAFFATAPLMVQVMVFMLLSEYPDIEADSSAGKRNLVVRMGRDRTRPVAMLVILGGAAASIIGILGGVSEMNAFSIALIFTVEAAVIAAILRLLRSARLGYNWLTSASIGFLVLMILVSSLTF